MAPINGRPNGGAGIRLEEARLPGIGLRHDFQTQRGRRVGVVSHRSGRRDLLVYDPNDPDRCSETVQLTSDEADTLAELLGAPRIIERLAAMHEQMAGLVSEQLVIESGSPYDGRTLGDTQLRTRTRASVVAVLRQEAVIPAPAPDFRFSPGDIIVIVGTPEGIAAASGIVSG